MTEPSYSPGLDGPTLLYRFQSHVLKGATEDEAAARLTREIESGRLEVRPPLKPGWRLQPTPPKPAELVQWTRETLDGKIEVRPGKVGSCLPCLDVVNADGAGIGAENFYGRVCSGPPITPPPFVLPRPVAAPTIRQQARKKSKARPEKSKAEAKPKAERKLVTRYTSYERQEWKKIVPHLRTLFDAGDLPDLNAAFRAVSAWLDARGLTMSKGSIYAGLERHRADWCE